jgi:hypothetical protein
LNNGGFRSKKLFTFVTNQRNLAYGNQLPPHLLDASSAFSHPDMVYALIPSCNGTRHQIYIGETSVGIMERLKKHISDASNHVQNHFQVNRRDYAHYRYLRDHKFLPTAFIVIPLQLIPPAAQLSPLAVDAATANKTAKAFRLYAESRFTCFFHSHAPFGWNSRHSSCLQPIRHDFEHHLPQMLRGMNPDPIVDSFKVAANISYYLKNPTLLPAIGVLTNLIERQHAQPTAATLSSTNRTLLYQVVQILSSTSHKHLGISPNRQHHLVHIINDFLHPTTNAPTHVFDRFTTAKMIFMDSSYSWIGRFLDINILIKQHPTLLRYWDPVRQYPEHPLPPHFSFVSSPPTKPTMADNTKLSKQLLWADLVHGLPSCACRAMCDQHNVSCHPSVPHIITSQYCPLVHPNNAYALVLQQGANFRLPPVISSDLPSLIDSYINDACSKTSIFLNTNFRNAPWVPSWQGEFRYILHQARDQYIAQLQLQPQCPLTAYLLDISKYHATPADKIQWDLLRRDFCILQADKAASVYLIVCKHWALEQIRTDLSCQQFFMAQPPTATVAATAARIANFLLTRYGIVVASPDIGHYYPTVKLHKAVPCCRFLVGSKCSVYEPPSIILSQLLGMCVNFADYRWASYISANLSYVSDPAHFPCQQSWILRSSSDIRPILDLFNRVRAANYDNATPIPLTTADFSRLYTNIDLADLKTRIKQLVDLFFDYHAAKHYDAIKIYHNQHLKPQWLKLNGHQPQTDAAYVILTKAGFAELFDYLIDNTFFQFGGQLFKQTQGIVMGSNMAVHLANLYLFTYEYEFLTQPVFVRPREGTADFDITLQMWHRASDILKHFMFTRRYVDDLISFGNRALDRHHAALLSIHGSYNITLQGRSWPIRGIYPNADLVRGIDGLDITIKSASKTTPFYNIFMDIGFHLITLDGCQNGQRLCASLYDKRDHDLNMLPTPTYTHVDSHVSYFQLINTFYSQAVRAARIVTDHRFWVQACSTFYRRMLTAGHDKFDMWCVIDKSMAHGAKTFCIPKSHLILEFLTAVGDPDLYHFYHGSNDLSDFADVVPSHAHVVADALVADPGDVMDCW